MLRLIFLFVASLVNTSLRIDIVEMLSDLKIASPFLKRTNTTGRRLDQASKELIDQSALLRYHRIPNLNQKRYMKRDNLHESFYLFTAEGIVILMNSGVDKALNITSRNLMSNTVRAYRVKEYYNCFTRV